MKEGKKEWVPVKVVSDPSDKYNIRCMSFRSILSVSRWNSQLKSPLLKSVVSPPQSLLELTQELNMILS